MHLVKVLTEDLYFIFRFVVLLFKNNFKVKTALFYPEFPSKRSALYKVVKACNFNITNNPTLKHQISIYWQNETFRLPTNGYSFFNQKTINKNCLDISKTFIDKHHLTAFGYQTQINPLTYNQKFVQKGELNAQHDGKIHHHPITKTEEGYIYQELIDNTDNNWVNDLRTPVFKGEIPYVVIRSRKVEERFGGGSQKARMFKTEDIFSEDEQKAIKNFTELIGLDYGDLDILRDRNTNKIYVVDANPTAWGPTNGLTPKEKKLALLKMKNLFTRLFLD